MTSPDPNRDARVTEFIDLLARLAPEDFRAVIVNLFDAAVSYPEEATSRAFFRQIRVHAESKGAPYDGIPA